MFFILFELLYPRWDNHNDLHDVKVIENLINSIYIYTT